MEIIIWSSFYVIYVMLWPWSLDNDNDKIASECTLED